MRVNGSSPRETAPPPKPRARPVQAAEQPQQKAEPVKAPAPQRVDVKA
ncbi:MAG: hypothetical protein WCO62_13780 [Betaproteobacteria bacterium]|nr:hypothetical protein [Burkholderiales bacterium]